MIVIQVHDNDISFYKILIGAIALPVLRADVVKRHGSAELFFAVDHHLAWIAAVLLIADAIGAVKCNLHFIAHLSQKMELSSLNIQPPADTKNSGTTSKNLFHKNL